MNKFPENVHLVSTPRMIEGGVTQNNYQNFNLATHVGDDLDLVERNRALLVKHD